MSVCASAESSQAGVKLTYVDYNQADVSFGEIAAGSTAQVGFNKITSGTVDWGNVGWNVNYVGYIQVDASAVEGTIQNVSLTFDVSGSTDSKRTTGWGVGYNSSAWSADMTYNTADLSITTLGDQQWTSTKSSGTFETKTFDITDAFAEDEDKIVTIVVYEIAAAGGYLKNPSATVTYTTGSVSNYYIVRELDSETQIDTITYKSAIVGTEVSASETDKANFYFDGVKYVYVSGGEQALTVDEDDTKNYIHLTFKEADIINYTIMSSLGEELDFGNSYVGDAVKYAYPRYQELNGTLYQSSVNNKEYTNTFTPTAANPEAVVNYSNTNKENIVYLNEGEHINGFTETTTGNLPIRGSNGKGGVTTEDVTIVSLPAGKYVMVVGAFTSKTSQQNLNFTVGGTAYTASSSGNLSENTSSEFTLTGETNDVVFLGSTSSADAQLDYLYIQKTGEYNYFEIEANLPDTVTVTLGEVEDYAKLNLSDYISVKTNAEEYFPVINYAVAEEGVDKKDATYTPVLSEKPLYEVFTEPGTYYVFANVVAVFADESVDNVSTDTIVIVLKEKEAEQAEEPGVKYSYTLTSDITQLGTYDVTGGSIELLNGALETKNNLYGQKSGSSITAQVNMERKLKVNDCIKITMFCSSNNKATGFDITKDGSTSLVYFPLPSSNNKANTYTIEYIVKETDVNLIGVDTFSIKKITATDNLYLTGVEVEVLEKKAPEFTALSESKNVAVYEYAILTAKASGFPEPKYQWYVDGELVEGATEASYALWIEEEKTYNVYVKATNSEASINSDVIVLKGIADKELADNKLVVPTDMEVADNIWFNGNNIHVILADKGGFTVQNADAAEAPAGYSAIISGTTNPVVTEDNVTGVAYKILPEVNGVFTFVGKFNAGKAVNVVRKAYTLSAKATAGSLQADDEAVKFKVDETEYNSGDSFTETYNGPITIDMEEGYLYYLYASGSKIGMYGFDFTETTAVDGVAEAQAETSAPVKFFKNGQLIIAKDGKKFNAAGAELK